MSDEERIERVARSLCRRAGFDPDAAADDAEIDSGDGAVAPGAPAWMAYIARARAYVTAARALKMI